MTENQEVTFALSDLKEILVKVSNALEAISKISDTLREYITKLLSLERFVGELAQKVDMIDKATAQGFMQLEAKQKLIADPAALKLVADKDEMPAT